MKRLPVNRLSIALIRAFACAWLCGVIFSANATEQTYAGHPAAMAFAARWAALPPPFNGWTVRHLPADLMQRPTPRILEGARQLCAHLDAVRGARR